MIITPLNDELINNIIDLTRQAGFTIMEIYNTEFDIDTKEDKRGYEIYRSPITEADKRAHIIIMEGLKKLTPDIPVLSEEGQEIAYEERKKWESFWLVDPLDGTKDFIKKNGEFTVNIALIKDNAPVFGVVYAPAIDLLFWGSLENGAWKKEAHNPAQAMRVADKIDETVKIASSRSHPSDKMDAFLAQFNNFKLHTIGSSLKICLVSDGSVHLYPRLGPTMEWDTAAAHAVLKSAGGEMLQFGTDSPLQYNKKELLNPKFIAGSLSMISGLKTCN